MSANEIDLFPIAMLLGFVISLILVLLGAMVFYHLERDDGGDEL